MNEAEAVVSAIIQHGMVSPDESLGVGAFNKKQAELIYDLLEKRCDEDASARLAVDTTKEA